MSKKNVSTDPRITDLFRGESPAIRLLAAMVAGLHSEDSLDKLIDEHSDRGADMRGIVAGRPFVNWFGLTQEQVEGQGLTPEQVKEVSDAHRARGLEFGKAAPAPAAEAGADKNGKKRGRPPGSKNRMSPAMEAETRGRVARGDGAALAQAEASDVPQSPEGSTLSRGDGTPLEPAESGASPAGSATERRTAIPQENPDDPAFAGHAYSTLLRDGELLPDDELIKLPNVGPATVKAIKAHHRKAAK